MALAKIGLVLEADQRRVADQIRNIVCQHVGRKILLVGGVQARRKPVRKPAHDAVSTKPANYKNRTVSFSLQDLQSQDVYKTLSHVDKVL